MYPLPAEASSPGRRYDLDWLRVIAFGLLILYHVGMFYVSWDWHVKSVHAGPAIEPLMLAVNPWRLTLLFFISGAAIRFALDKSGAAKIARSRLLRLGLPIVFGMVVVVAPQSYFELREAGVIEPGYGSFFVRYLTAEPPFPITTPTWNHLWYLVYLLVYTMLIAALWCPLSAALRHRPLGRITGSRLAVIALPLIPFMIADLFLAPRFEVTHALTDDWYTHAASGYAVLLGLFASKDERFWSAVDRSFVFTAAIVIILLPSRLWANTWFFSLEEAIGTEARNFIWTPIRALYAWSTILALLGGARRFLSQPSPVLSYLTSAVFCLYIAHQTITVSAGYALTRMGLPAALEAALLVLATATGSFIIYEVFKRIPVVRVALGIRRAR